ncbi:MAG: enoyl-CoA hydratase/isomerase family protein [Acidobacteria bacterium]|nr:enoyl-CoA hydratase/isomerase family protein [Acidobacteriota bacterium]
MTGGDESARSSSIIVEERNSLAFIRINRPSERNSLSVATLEEIERVFISLAASDRTTGVIFTGTGDVFASGADICELRTLTPAAAREFAARGQRLFQRIADAPQLTIAAINGYCMGGGLDLALACRVRVASPDAVFAHPGARLGIITGWGGTQRLPRLVGAARAFEMFGTARRVGASEALEIGLVDALAEDVLEGVLEIARTRVWAMVTTSREAASS